MLGLPISAFTADGLEFHGKVNYLKGGLAFSDSITTVSKSYAEEIQQPYFGENLDGFLVKRQADTYGIINGIDYGVHIIQLMIQIFIRTIPGGVPTNGLITSLR